ncbi:MAG: DNA-binding response regulator [Planctomycetes bacterium GWF2_41_51]|nr:MAG: DNA-binding response regulator [Planctomycetes bacterium GWF2_41_51]HBG25521.1 DNA-binding response regulator [Phycisphaerales bacterium]
MAIKIFLSDDHAIVRDGLRRSLQQEEDMEVIGQAKDGLTTIQMVRDLNPDIILMDISMPDINGMDTCREITRDFPNIKVIGLSMHSAKKFVSEMFKAGAAGYLPKNCEYDELSTAIRTVMSGKTYLSPAITDVLVDNFVRTSPEENNSVFYTLTKRERQVLQLMAEGKTTKQIGQSLHISPKTVEAHRLRVMEKLNINNVAQLTKYAIQEGLTSVEI